MEKTLRLVSYEYGRLAFEKGKKCVPAWDKDFCENILAGLKNGESIKYLKAWSKGWTDANLKAEI